jgi:hypothetical protein
MLAVLVTCSCIVIYEVVSATEEADSSVRVVVISVVSSVVWVTADVIVSSKKMLLSKKLHYIIADAA